MDNTHEAQRTKPTFQTNGIRSKANPKSAMPNTAVLHETSATTLQRQRRNRKKPRHDVNRIKSTHEQKDDEKINCGCEDEADEREEVKRKMETLKRIVPGGGSVHGADKLFEQTAGYILALQCQVKAMKALSSFFRSFEKENTKFGG